MIIVANHFEPPAEYAADVDLLGLRALFALGAHQRIVIESCLWNLDRCPFEAWSGDDHTDHRTVMQARCEMIEQWQSALPGSG